ncbi:unnamed protein product [Ectocarpus fasciculatus]
MTSVADDQHWFKRAMKDYNETRASDLVVINFGARYHNTAEGDEAFKRDVFSVLDDMAEVGETATVVWREIAPTHFPAENGTYDAFVDIGLGNTACCTGTPVKVLDRNAWVQNYLRDNGLSDKGEAAAHLRHVHPAACRTPHLPPCPAFYHGPGRGRKRLLPLLLRHRLQALVGDWRLRGVECAAAEPFMPDGIARLHLSSEVQLSRSVEFCFRGCRNKEFREGFCPCFPSLLDTAYKNSVYFFGLQEFSPPSSCGLTGQQQYL